MYNILIKYREESSHLSPDIAPSYLNIIWYPNF